ARGTQSRSAAALRTRGLRSQQIEPYTVRFHRITQGFTRGRIREAGRVEGRAALETRGRLPRMRTTTAWILGFGSSCVLALAARADVTDIRENSFTIESRVTTTATAAVVYRELGKVSRWWDPEHTWSGSAKNLSLQMQAGG